MRRHSFIALFLCVVVLVMAGTSQQFWKRKKKNLSPQESAEPVDSVVHDSLGNVAVDTTKMDSLQKAIVRYNKAIDDSIRLDSINRAKASGIDAPVNYEAQDSLVYDAASQTAHLYGSSKVGYQSYNLTSDRIKMSMGSDLVHAVGTPDSTAEGGVKVKPVFKMGSDQYDTDTIAFNFKSKKAYIDNVYTEQQDGFLRGEKSKRDSTGLIYLQHGKYTTCDKDDPDFTCKLCKAIGADYTPMESVNIELIEYEKKMRKALEEVTLDSEMISNAGSTASTQSDLVFLLKNGKKYMKNLKHIMKML